MSVHQEYERIKELAQIKREIYNPHDEKIGLRLLGKIFKEENIHIFPYKRPLKNLRAAYIFDGEDSDILIKDSLPREPKIFALTHELKHHYCDQEKLQGLSCHMEYDEEPLIEKTAEVFASEFIWPEKSFHSMAKDFGLKKGNCSPELIIAFKKATDQPVSYKFMRKRLEWFNLIEKGEHNSVQFTKLEYSIYGIPPWKRKQARN